MSSSRHFAAFLTLTLAAWNSVAVAQPSRECDPSYGVCASSVSRCNSGAPSGALVLSGKTDLFREYQIEDDYDNDGVDDTLDNCPRFSNLTQADRDDDGAGDPCDNCPGDPNNGAATVQGDLDADGIGDACDSDQDGDAVLNAVDNCPRASNFAVAGTQPNLDGDSQGDACDDDVDGDRVANAADTCPLSASPTATGAACFPDSDGDGISEFDRARPDRCPTIADSDQLDIDNDGIGDACDPDDDNDSIADIRDNCRLVANANQANLDRDRSNNSANAPALAAFGGDACDNAYCYTVNGDEANCLDPRAGLRAYSPALLLETGREFRLPIFINRSQDSALAGPDRSASVSYTYSWRIFSAPPGSTVGVRNPSGMIAEGFRHEYEYSSGAVASFRPDVDGVYRLDITVTDATRTDLTSTFQTELIALAPCEAPDAGIADASTDARASDASTGTLDATTGPPPRGSGGFCSVRSPPARRSSFAVMIAFSAFALVLRRAQSVKTSRRLP